MASPLRLHSDELLFFFDISLKETRQCDDFLYTEFFIILPINYPTFTILSQVPYLSKPNIFCWSVSAIVTRWIPPAVATRHAILIISKNSKLNKKKDRFHHAFTRLLRSFLYCFNHATHRLFRLQSTHRMSHTLSDHLLLLCCSCFLDRFLPDDYT